MTSVPKHRLIFLVLALALAACLSTPTSPAPVPAPARPAALPADAVSYSGGDGSSLDKAVVIQAANARSGVRAEYAWLAQHYPGYARGSQSLLTPGGKPYDLIEFRTIDGQTKSVYFDISAFFGKF